MGTGNDFFCVRAAEVDEPWGSALLLLPPDLGSGQGLDERERDKPSFIHDRSAFFASNGPWGDRQLVS